MNKNSSLILSLILLVVMAFAIGGSTAPVSALTSGTSNNPQSTDGKSIQITPTPAPPNWNTGLSVGSLAFVIAPPDNVVRANPGLGGQRIGSFPARTVLEIREGPVYANGMVWWKAYSRAQNLLGWTPDGAPSWQGREQFLAPYFGVTVCANTYRTRLAVGTRAYVLSDPPQPNRVRQWPGTYYPVKGRIYPGHTMRVISGPYCVQNMVWWEVISDSNLNLRGYTSEGDWSNYFLAPLTLP